LQQCRGNANGARSNMNVKANSPYPAHVKCVALLYERHFGIEFEIGKGIIDQQQAEKYDRYPEQKGKAEKHGLFGGEQAAVGGGVHGLFVFYTDVL
jgi:hypothetical protein